MIHFRPQQVPLKARAKEWLLSKNKKLLKISRNKLSNKKYLSTLWCREMNRFHFLIICPLLIQMEDFIQTQSLKLVRIMIQIMSWKSLFLKRSQELRRRKIRDHNSKNWFKSKKIIHRISKNTPFKNKRTGFRLDLFN